MNPAFIVRFQPTGPWRIGPDSGARDRIDRIFHSDSLFSAVTHAMARLGRLEDWLDATVRNPEGAGVRFSSCFPYMEEVYFIAPPLTHWPPPPSPKVRWKTARFVPLPVVQALVSDRPLNDGRWYMDGPSECLLPVEAEFRSGPFRPATRSHAAVDRLGGAAVEVHRTACLEFAPGGGLWAAVSFADNEVESRWSDVLKGALRLLADSGLGGERSLGWGRSAPPEFIEGFLPDMLLPAPPPAPEPAGAEVEGAEAPKPAPETGWWLLSIFSPAAGDVIDWRRGNYSVVTRGGRIEGQRSGEEKKLVRMIGEGSVLAGNGPLRGAAPDVAPDGFPHPVFRAGFALAIPIPLRPPERHLGAI